MARHARPSGRRPLLLAALVGAVLGGLVAVLRRWGGDTSCLDAASDGVLRQCAAVAAAPWAVALAAVMGAALAVALARRRR